MPDGSEWAYSVMDIARNRAEHYADEYGGDVERSLAEDTLPLFRARALLARLDAGEKPDA
jgi:hypothetical protein